MTRVVLGSVASIAFSLGALALIACAKADNGAPPSDVQTDIDSGAKTVADAAIDAATDGAALLIHSSVTVGTNVRTYELAIPQGTLPVGKLPLVVAFHGSNQTGDFMRNALAIEPVAAGGAIFAYPDAMGATLDWDIADDADSNPDVAFFDAMLTAIASAHPYDASRVFTAGFSRGGFFSNQIGCFRNDKVRAIAAYEGGGPEATGSPMYDANGQLICPGTTQTIAALMVHADDDPVVKISVGEESLTHWTYENDCATSSTPMAPSPCVSWNGCAPAVVWCEITTPNGHTIWSGAAQATWSFFSSLR